MTRHLVFTGNPGTGKTTVARLVGGIYQALGLLSRGHLVEVDRSELVAGYLGQTATKTAEVVASAAGGVLFIDEAYSLTGDRAGGDQYGQESVDTLVKEMEDRRDDLVVIVAGYPAPMAAFIAANPGLASRFRTTIEFEDYTDDELVAILRQLAAGADYELEPEAVERFREVLGAHPAATALRQRPLRPQRPRGGHRPPRVAAARDGSAHPRAAPPARGPRLRRGTARRGSARRPSPASDAGPAPADPDTGDRTLTPEAPRDDPPPPATLPRPRAWRSAPPRARPAGRRTTSPPSGPGRRADPRRRPRPASGAGWTRWGLDPCARWSGTPGRLRAVGIVSVVATLLFGLAAGQAFRSADGALERAAANSDQLVRIQAIQTNVVQADADATNAFLVGGLEPAGQRADYTGAIASASAARSPRPRSTSRPTGTPSARSTSRSSPTPARSSRPGPTTARPCRSGRSTSRTPARTCAPTPCRC